MSWNLETCVCTCYPMRYFFRSEEVLNIRMSNIRFYEGFMIIEVVKRKTDQLRQGDEVVIAQSEGNVCPVFLLKEYLKKLDISPDSSEFIFRPLVKTKSFYKLVKVDKHISYATFRGQLTKSLQSIDPGFSLSTGLTLSGLEERRGLPAAGLVIELFRGMADGKVSQLRMVT